jgi:DNA-directed RNA polymerase subunit beta
VAVKKDGETHLAGMRAEEDIKDKREDVVRKGKKITKAAIADLRRLKKDKVIVNVADLEGAYSLEDIVNTETGEVIVESNTEIVAGKLQQLVEEGIKSFSVFFPKRDVIGEIISATLRKDPISKPVDALLEIYRKMRPGDPPTVPTSYRLLEGMFFDTRRFDLSRVGRLKFNIKMGRPERDRLTDPLLQAGDFIEVVKYLLRMKRDSENYGQDDIDHLGNRRVRAVGELLENQFRIGLERMERAIKEKMSDSTGHVHYDAARPRQRQAGDGCRPRILWLVAAVAVHGPDQSAQRDHAQASPVGPRAGRPFT